MRLGPGVWLSEYKKPLTELFYKFSFTGEAPVNYQTGKKQFGPKGKQLVWLMAQ